MSIFVLKRSLLLSMLSFAQVHSKLNRRESIYWVWEIRPSLVSLIIDIRTLFIWIYESMYRFFSPVERDVFCCGFDMCYWIQRCS